MATVSARLPKIAVIAIMALIQGGVFVALGLSVSFASYYMSDMKFIFGPIDPSAFHLVRVALGDIAVILGVASVAIGLAMLRGKRLLWLSNIIVAGLVVAVLLAIYDIMYQPVYVLVIPLAVSAMLVANLLGQKYARR